MNRRAVLLVFMTVLAVCAAGASLAAAAPPDRSVTRTTYVSLFAYDEETGTYISVFPDYGGYRVCVGTPMGWGCSWVGDDALTIDKKLDSATLAPTTVFVEMCDYSSGYPSCTYDEITVAVTFEGTGDLIRSQSRYKSKNGCMYMFSGKTVARTGEAIITLDGESHEGEGYVAVSTETIREQCKN